MLQDTKLRKAKTRRVLESARSKREARNDLARITMLLRFEVDYNTTSDCVGQTSRGGDASRVCCLSRKARLVRLTEIRLCAFLVDSLPCILQLQQQPIK